MSLAMYASPINDMNDTLLPEQQQHQQQRRSRTQRNRNEKVNSVIKTLRNLPPINHYDDNTNNLGDFTPMEPPKSIGATKTQEKENHNNNNDDNNDDDSLPPVIPMFQRDGFQGYNSNNQENSDNILSSDVAIKKLNYVISLLEEQQDSKTSNIAEEVVLYFFLGIFIIFIVDSFVKVGKYIR